MQFHFLSRFSSNAGYCQEEHRYDGFISLTVKLSFADSCFTATTFPNQSRRHWLSYVM